MIEIEKKNNQIRAENACVKTANFPFIKTMDDFDFEFQPSIQKKQLLELNQLGFIDVLPPHARDFSRELGGFLLES